MKVLVLGSGGREHALALGVLKSSLVTRVYVHPGNPGIFLSPGLGPLFSASDKNLSCQAISIQAKVCGIQMIIIGPENLLAQGYADFLREQGFKVIGPGKEAAQLESSKAFAKTFMEQYGIPTSPYFATSSLQEAEKFITESSFSLVIKADELAQGKGVLVTDSKAEAKEAVWSLISADSKFSVKSKKIILERRLRGYELSAIALVDGDSFFILGYAQDYKRAFEGDQGPNTGGMGAQLRSSQDWPRPSIQRQTELIFQKSLMGLKDRALPYQGFMFLGLMIEGEQAFLLEYNVRSGDPETQVLIPSLKIDLGLLFHHVTEKTIHKIGHHNIPDQSFVHVVLASGGYPDVEAVGMKLGQSLDIAAEVQNSNEVSLFYAGVASGKNGQLLNCGGRVLGVTASAKTISQARTKAYQALEKIKLEGGFFRRDIGEEK